MTTNAVRTIKEEVRNLCQRKRALTYEKMVDIIKERHPDANTSVKTVQWYASKLRREGVEVHVLDGRSLTRPSANDAKVDYALPEHDRRRSDDRRTEGARAGR